MFKGFFGAVVIIAVLGLGSGCGVASDGVGGSGMSAEDIEARQVEIMDDFQAGLIDKDEMSRLLDELPDDSLRIHGERHENGKVTDFSGLPPWAMEIGVVEPRGLDLIEGESKIINEDDKSPDSITLTYSGSKDVIFAEAKRISAEMGLEVGFEADEVFMADGNKKDGDYTISLSVARVGDGYQMVLDAVDQAFLEGQRNELKGN